MEIICGLPEELAEEILSRLPVKSLLRLKCVSKAWQSLIGSQQFMKTHLRKSTNNTDVPYHRVIIKKKPRYSEPHVECCLGLKQCNLQSLLNDSSIVPSPTANGPTINGLCSIVGSCNGLVCIFEKPRQFFLWNPATRISTKLPIVGMDDGNRKKDEILHSGFGWDESSGAYKVLVAVFTTPDCCSSYKVYNSKTNSWKKIEHSSPRYEFILTGHGQYACGKLHWFKASGCVIVSLDLKSEVFGMMEAPCKPEGLFNKLWLGEIGGCLSAVCSHQTDNANANERLDVWVMKEYSSWLKVATIPQVKHDPNGMNPFTPLFGGGPNGEILLLNGDSFFVYNPKDNNVFSASRNYTIIMAASVYVESLASPLPAETKTNWLNSVFSSMCKRCLLVATLIYCLVLLLFITTINSHMH